jgi:hypothetical protein
MSIYVKLPGSSDILCKALLLPTDNEENLLGMDFLCHFCILLSGGRSIELMPYTLLRVVRVCKTEYYGVKTNGRKKEVYAKDVRLRLSFLLQTVPTSV